MQGVEEALNLREDYWVRSWFERFLFQGEVCATQLDRLYLARLRVARVLCLTIPPRKSLETLTAGTASAFHRQGQQDINTKE